jgi:peptidoglycan glycosyltransferase
LPSRVLAEESAGELQAFPPEWYPRNIGLTGQAGVGQNLVEATPLQMAAVAAVIAGKGLYREPHLVREIRRRETAPAAGETGDEEVSWLDRTRPDIPEPRRALSEEAALAVARDMRLVVTEGTGRRMLDPEFPLAGKTGTAQTGDMDGDGLDEEPHAWFIAFAPVDDPKVAVAVVVEHGGSGGRVAGPVARRVLEAAVASLAEEEEP